MGEITNLTKIQSLLMKIQLWRIILTLNQPSSHDTKLQNFCLYSEVAEEMKNILFILRIPLVYLSNYKSVATLIS